MSEAHTSDRERDAAAAVASWLHHIRAFDENQFMTEFVSDWERLGTIDFVTWRVAPFLTALGEGWARGEISVAEEHFASQRIRFELYNLWKPLSAWNFTGELLVLATLPGEQHDLGLHMLASVAAECGYRILLLGTDTPITAMLEAATNAPAAVPAVMISVSAHAEPSRTVAGLRELRATLPASVQLVVGGGGAPASVEGAMVLEDLRAAHAWLAAHRGYDAPTPRSAGGDVTFPSERSA